MTYILKLEWSFWEIKKTIAKNNLECKPKIIWTANQTNSGMQANLKDCMLGINQNCHNIYIKILTTLQEVH